MALLSLFALFTLFSVGRADCDTPTLYHYHELDASRVVLECGDVPIQQQFVASDGATVTTSETTYSGTDPDDSSKTESGFLRTWTVTRGSCEKGFTKVQTVIVQDKTPPVIQAHSLASSDVVECDDIPDCDKLSVSAHDSCPSSIVEVEFTETPTSASTCDTDTKVLQTITRKWVFTDSSGNTKAHEQELTVKDSNAPEIMFLDGQCTTDGDESCDTKVECVGSPSTQPPDAIAIDNCDTVTVKVVAKSASGNDDDDECIVKRTVFTYTAEDKCGNKVERKRTVTVKDTKPPTLGHVQAIIEADCAAVPEPCPPEASDLCDANVTVTYTVDTDSQPCDNTYSRTITYTATDDCGQTATKTQQLIVTDDEGPVLSNLPLTATANCLAYPKYDVTGKDNCDTCVDILQTTETEYTGDYENTTNYNRIVTFTWSAVDSCGNPAEDRTQVVTFTDVDPPTLRTDFSEDPIDVPCTDEWGTLNGMSDPVFNDNCCDDIQVIEKYPTWNSACDADPLEVTYTAVDCAGNRAEDIYTRTFNVFDNDPPSFVKGQEPSLTFGNHDELASILVSTPDGYTVTNLEYDDGTNCMGDLDFLALLSDEGNFEYQAKDACNNGEGVTFAPVLVTSDENCAKVYHVYYTVSDKCGNSKTSTDPIVLTVKEDKIVDETILSNLSQRYKLCGWSVEDIDAYFNDELPTQSGCYNLNSRWEQVAQGADFPLCDVVYELTIEYGDCGREFTREFTFESKNQNGLRPVPVWDENAEKWKDDDEFCPDINTETSKVSTDICDAEPRCGATYVVTETATNRCGDTATRTYNTGESDNTPPQVHPDHPDVIHVPCQAPGAQYSCPPTKFSDDSFAQLYDTQGTCQGEIEVAAKKPHGEIVTPEGSCNVQYKCTYEVDDCAGNTGSATTTLIVVDTATPIFVDPHYWNHHEEVECASPAGVSAGCDAPAFQCAENTRASDHCGGYLPEQPVCRLENTATSPPTVIDTFPNSAAVDDQLRFTYTATDSCGNSVTMTRPVHVVDTVPPTLTLSDAAPVTSCQNWPDAPTVHASDCCNTDVDYSTDVDGSVSGCLEDADGSKYLEKTYTYRANDGSAFTEDVTATRVYRMNIDPVIDDSDGLPTDTTFWCKVPGLSVTISSCSGSEVITGELDTSPDGPDNNGDQFTVTFSPSRDDDGNVMINNVVQKCSVDFEISDYNGEYLYPQFADPVVNGDGSRDIGKCDNKGFIQDLFDHEDDVDTFIKGDDFWKGEFGTVNWFPNDDRITSDCDDEIFSNSPCRCSSVITYTLDGSACDGSVTATYTLTDNLSTSNEYTTSITLSWKDYSKPTLAPGSGFNDIASVDEVTSDMFSDNCDCFDYICTETTTSTCYGSETTISCVVTDECGNNDSFETEFSCDACLYSLDGEATVDESSCGEDPLTYNDYRPVCFYNGDTTGKTATEIEKLNNAAQAYCNIDADNNGVPDHLTVTETQSTCAESQNTCGNLNLPLCFRARTWTLKCIPLDASNEASGRCGRQGLAIPAECDLPFDQTVKFHDTEKPTHSVTPIDQSGNCEPEQNTVELADNCADTFCKAKVTCQRVDEESDYPDCDVEGEHTITFTFECSGGEDNAGNTAETSRHTVTSTNQVAPIIHKNADCTSGQMSFWEWAGNNYDDTPPTCTAYVEDDLKTVQHNCATLTSVPSEEVHDCPYRREISYTFDAVDDHCNDAEQVVHTYKALFGGANDPYNSVAETDAAEAFGEDDDNDGDCADLHVNFVNDLEAFKKSIQDDHSSMTVTYYQTVAGSKKQVDSFEVSPGTTGYEFDISGPTGASNHPCGLEETDDLDFPKCYKFSYEYSDKDCGMSTKEEFYACECYHTPVPDKELTCPEKVSEECYGKGLEERFSEYETNEMENVIQSHLCDGMVATNIQVSDDVPACNDDGSGRTLTKTVSYQMCSKQPGSDAPTDDCITDTFKVTVTDTNAPVLDTEPFSVLDGAVLTPADQTPGYIKYTITSDDACEVDPIAPTFCDCGTATVAPESSESSTCPTGYESIYNIYTATDDDECGLSTVVHVEYCTKCPGHEDSLTANSYVCDSGNLADGTCTIQKTCDLGFRPDTPQIVDRCGNDWPTSPTPDTPTPGTCEESKTHTFTYTATAECTEAEVPFVVSVEHTITFGDLTCPTIPDQECQAAALPSVVGTKCGVANQPATPVDIPSDSADNIKNNRPQFMGSHSVNYTADCRSCTTSYTVKDTQAPSIEGVSCPAKLSYCAAQAKDNIYSHFATGSATDSCCAATLAAPNDSGAHDHCAGGAYTRVYSATDCNGNQAFSEARFEVEARKQSDVSIDDSALQKNYGSYKQEPTPDTNGAGVYYIRDECDDEGSFVPTLTASECVSANSDGTLLETSTNTNSNPSVHNCPDGTTLEYNVEYTFGTGSCAPTTFISFCRGNAAEPSIECPNDDQVECDHAVPAALADGTYSRSTNWDQFSQFFKNADLGCATAVTVASTDSQVTDVCESESKITRTYTLTLAGDIWGDSNPESSVKTCRQTIVITRPDPEFTFTAPSCDPCTLECEDIPAASVGSACFTSREVSVEPSTMVEQFCDQDYTIYTGFELKDDKDADAKYAQCNFQKSVPPAAETPCENTWTQKPDFQANGITIKGKCIVDELNADTHSFAWESTCNAFGSHQMTSIMDEGNTWQYDMSPDAFSDLDLTDICGVEGTLYLEHDVCDCHTDDIKKVTKVVIKKLGEDLTWKTGELSGAADAPTTEDLESLSCAADFNAFLNQKFSLHRECYGPYVTDVAPTVELTCHNNLPKLRGTWSALRDDSPPGTDLSCLEDHVLTAAINVAKPTVTAPDSTANCVSYAELAKVPFTTATAKDDCGSVTVTEIAGSRAKSTSGCQTTYTRQVQACTTKYDDVDDDDPCAGFVKNVCSEPVTQTHTVTNKGAYTLTAPLPEDRTDECCLRAIPTLQATNDCGEQAATVTGKLSEASPVEGKPGMKLYTVTYTIDDDCHTGASHSFTITLDQKGPTIESLVAQEAECTMPAVRTPTVGHLCDAAEYDMCTDEDFSVCLTYISTTTDGPCAPERIRDTKYTVKDGNGVTATTNVQDKLVDNGAPEILSVSPGDSSVQQITSWRGDKLFVNHGAAGDCKLYDGNGFANGKYMESVDGLTPEQIDSLMRKKCTRVASKCTSLEITDGEYTAYDCHTNPNTNPETKKVAAVGTNLVVANIESNRFETGCLSGVDCSDPHVWLPEVEDCYKPSEAGWWSEQTTATQPSSDEYSITVTDPCGNPSQEFLVVVERHDKVPPTFTFPEDDLEIEIPQGQCAPDSDDVQVQWADDCCGEVSHIVVPSFKQDCPTVNDDECYGDWTKTYTWTITDAAGNTNSRTVTYKSASSADSSVTILPGSGPSATKIEIEAPAWAYLDRPDTSVNHDADIGNLVKEEFIDQAPVFLDFRGLPITPTITTSGLHIDDVEEERDCWHTGTQTITWSAKDDCDNEKSVTATLVIKDNTPPMLDHEPANGNLPCDEFESLEKLKCDVSVVGEDINVDITAVDNEDGTYTVTYSAEDCAGNTVSHSQTITLVDNSPPVFTRRPESQTAPCDCGSLPEPDIGAVDNCDEDVTVELTIYRVNDDGTRTDVDAIDVDGEDQTPYNFPVTFVREWTATDSADKIAKHSQTITIVDNKAPDIVFNGEIIDDINKAKLTTLEVACDELAAEIDDIKNNLLLVDNCDAEPTSATTVGVAKGDRCPTDDNPDGEQNIVDVTASDRSGNAQTVTFKLLVKDSDAPVLDNPLYDSDKKLDREFSVTCDSDGLVQDGAARLAEFISGEGLYDDNGCSTFSPENLIRNSLDWDGPSNTVSFTVKDDCGFVSETYIAKFRCVP